MKAVLIATLFLQIILIGNGQNVLQCPRLRVFFEIDSSLSVTQDSFNNEVELVGSLINSFRHSTGSEAGFITFNSQVLLNSLSPLSSDLEIQMLRLNALALSVDTTSLVNALRYANESVFTEVTSSTNPQNILVLLTDGIDASAQMSVLSAISGDLTNQKSTIVIVVAFGSIPDTTQLQAIASPASGNRNLRIFANSNTAASNFQSIFTETNICNSVPLQAPTNLRTSLIEPRVIVIAWDPPTSPVTGFRVCYTTNTLANINNVCENSVEAPLSASSQSISSLAPFTSYRYAVFSINNNLVLGSTVEAVSTSQEGSSVPVGNLAAEVISYNTATVTFQAPPLEGRNGIITEYDVCYLPLGSEVCQPLAALTAQQFTHTASNLMANTQYTFRVTPLNSAAVQPRGETSQASFTTPRFPAITLLTATPISATEITVQWTPPSYPVMSYRLTATNGANVITVTPSGSVTSFVIPGASPFTNYSIMIEANTVNGLSLPSNTLYALTNQAVPSGQVQNLMAEGFTPTSIQVNFTEPPMALWNGILTSYFICVRNIPGTDCIQSAFVPYAPSVSHIIPGLISDTQYNVSVLASNIPGMGPEISDLATTPAADIAPVTFLRGFQSAARQITLYWSNPPDVSDSSLVGGIRVCYGMVGVDCQFSVDLGVTETTVVIDLPEAITPYNFAVSLTTPTGSRGEAATIQIPINILQVRSLMTEAVSTSEIVASWIAPRTVVGYVLTSYSVAVRVTGGILPIQSINTSPETLSIVIGGLDSSTDYTTTVIPVIQQNFFIISQSSSAVTFPASPADAPQTVSVDFALTRALRVSWTPPSVLTGTIVTYEIAYEGTTIDTLGVRSVNATMNQLFVTILMLEEAETYSIRVRARYDSGPGAFTIPVQGTTLEDAPSSPVTDLKASTQSDSVKVTWSAPPLLFRNGVISSYDVTCNYTDASGSDASITNTVDGQVREATLYNLPDRTTCSLTVVPNTMVGPGPASEAVLAATQSPLATDRLCDSFKISLSVVTVACAALVVTTIVMAAFMLIHYVKYHKNPGPEVGMELYAQPHLRPI